MTIIILKRAPRSAGGGGGGSAPAWAAAMSEDSWTTVAGASGKRITDVVPSPPPASNLGGESPNSIIDSWTGGGVNQSSKRLILAGNGGHSDYPGNEAYELCLDQDVPFWQRLCDPTPNASMQDITDAGAESYDDGRPRPTHNQNATFGDGRIWIPSMTATTSGQGGNVNKVVSFNRAALTGPYPEPYSGVNPWTIHGSTNANDNYIGFGVGLFDSVNHKVYCISNGQTSSGAEWWTINTTGVNLGVSTAFHDESPSYVVPQWGIIAQDLGIIVIGSFHANDVAASIKVLTLATNQWSTPSVSGSGLYTEGCGAVYISTGHSILVMNPKETSTMYKLSIPTSSGAYNPSGTFTWSSFTRSGAPSLSNFVRPTNNNNMRSKFALVDDMGDGRSYVVCPCTISGGTHVYKVPAAGI